MTAHITTFYSYSDALSRDDLLAEVAVSLAAHGDRVLVCDLDVVSPGMPPLGGAETQPRPVSGFMEWVRDWAHKRHMAEPDEAALGELTECVDCVADDSTLYVLPAHGDGADSAALAAEIPWHRFLVDEPLAGRTMLSTVVAMLSRQGSFDHVLLRCPCGLTDLGALLLVVVPHGAVLMGRYVLHDMRGLSRIYAATQAAVEGRLNERPLPLRRILVAGPVPDKPETLRARRRTDWDRLFKSAAGETRIEYHPDPQRLLGGPVQNSPASAQLARQIETLRSELMDQIARADSGSVPPEIERPGHAQARTRAFEERVAKLLSLMGYRVEREQYLDGDATPGLVATRQGGLRPERYFVEARDWRAPVSASQLTVFADWIDNSPNRQAGLAGMYVAPVFSPQAAALGQRRGVLMVTPAELERQLFDFEPYLEQIKRRFEESDLARTYVPQRLKGRVPDSDLLERAQSWCTGQGRRLWLLLGDYGTGKSVFFRRFTHQLARAALADPSAPVPIAIDLKEFPNAVSLEGLLQEHFRKTLAWHGDPDIFLHLLAAGRVVLLLDAFDEMGTAALSRGMQEQFRQLARAAQANGEGPRSNRVLVTCRTHFFRDHSQVVELADAAGTTGDSQLGQVARSLNADIDELALFDREQIVRYLEQALGRAPGAEALTFINQTHDLGNLASRPVLLEMMAKTLPSLMDGGDAVSPAALYRRYTDQWLEARAGDQLVTTPDQRRRLLEHLAFDLWGRPQHRVHFRDLRDALYRAPLELFGNLDPGRVDLELRHASFLTRTTEGYYSFSHKSFREFFFARCLQRGMLEGEAHFAAALDTAAVSRESVEFLHDLLEADQRDALARLCRGILAMPYRQRVSENALRVGYNAARLVLERQADPDWRDLPSHMAAFVPESGGVQLAGAQLGEIRLPFALLTGARLEGACLASADLSGADLGGADLRRVTLDRARLPSARLASADCTGAALCEANVSGADISGAKLDATDLTGAVLVEADLSRSTLQQARCHATRFARARLEGTSWTGADLTALTAPGAIGAPPEFGRTLPQRPEPYVQLGHGGSVESAVFSASGALLLTASYDRTATVWDARTGVELRRCTGHTGGVTSAVFSADGRRVLTTSHDRTARLWETDSGREVRRFAGHGASVFTGALSPDGRLAVTAGRDNTARLWDATTGEQLHRLQGHRDWLTSAVFTRDGQSVVTAGRDGTVRLWEVRTGRQERCLDIHGRAVTSALLCADGSQLLSASGDGTARLWDMMDGTELRRFAGHGASVSTACFSPDERQVLTASADGTARVWDRSTGAEQLRLEGHSAWVRSAVISHDGRLVLTASRDGSARLWDARTGRETRQMTGRGAWVSSGTLSGDGNRVLTAGRDGFAHLWDAVNGSELLRFEGHSGWVRSARLSPDGRTVATASHDRSVRLWDTASGACLRTLQGHDDWAVAVGFSRDGSRLVSGGADGTACIWEVFSGQLVRRLDAHLEGVESAVFSPDGRRLLTAGGDGSARLWEIRNGTQCARFDGHGTWVTSAVFNLDGRRVLTAGHDGTARLWDVRTGRELVSYDGHRGWVTSARFGRAEQWVITAGNDGTVRLWGADSGEELRCLEGHGMPVTSTEVSADGKTILSTGMDCTARLWDADSGALRRTLICVVGGWLSLCPDGHFSGAGTGPSRLSYRDPDETSARPTLWNAIDLPEMQVESATTSEGARDTKTHPAVAAPPS
jgi:WD40 repeat protein/uncharacterized protein YjbI with pentapeptide repeats